MQKISQVAHYVPEQVVTNHDLAQIMDTNDGVDFKSDGEYDKGIFQEQNLLVIWLQRLLETDVKAGITGEELDFII